jgi:hypothetical protein
MPSGSIAQASGSDGLTRLESALMRAASREDIKRQAGRQMTRVVSILIEALD